MAYAEFRSSKTKFAFMHCAHGERSNHWKDNSLLMIQQAGRSISTGIGAYAQSVDLFGESAPANYSQIIAKYRRASQIWQADIGLSTGNLLNCTCEANTVILPNESTRKNSYPLTFDPQCSLRVITGNMEAKFCDASQLTVIVLASQMRTHLAFILPTGYGKTAIASGPIYSEDKITIWRSPFIALKSATHEKLQQVVLRVCDFIDFALSESKDINVLMITIEDVARRDAFSKTIHYLTRENMIARVVKG